MGGTASSVTDEAAITKISLTSHGATGKSDSTEDSASSTKVEVVSQATYFAPVASLSPAQQIANAVAPLVTSPDGAGTGFIQCVIAPGRHAGHRHWRDACGGAARPFGGQNSRFTT